ncbi:PepSY-like domain-containing protein [Marseilla massiliensis]|uniref:PepSY-like domain-containing protein n=1 Tax=Marseilla massiliensis TaxID=1841864 RepID=A0A939B5K2_9BACT|nr:PepSY-like domain-containing protein [Marseilla massiliensis]MBM6662544.1 PepSY-like domain-containing protein [Marseilla massiliensis]
MKKWKWIGMAMACAVGMVAFTSCDDDDNDDYARVPDAVTAAFSHQYGNPGYVEWDSERGGYYVAEFRKDGRDHEAWYTQAGLWAMTEVDYGRSLADLPQAVQSGYAATAYALDAWTVDDIDEIQRPDYETVYKIEVEKRGQADHDLYFDLGGTLYRDVEGSGSGSGNGGMIQQGMPAEVKAYVDSAFAGAAVVDFDIEDNGMIEVDLRHGGKSVEVLFTAAYEWVMTKTDCSRDVPAVVADAVRQALPGARIDDCDYVQTATESYYLVDTDNPDRDLRVTPDGQVTQAW